MTLNPLITTRTTIPVVFDVRRRARTIPLITCTHPSKNPTLQISSKVSTAFALDMLRDLRLALRRHGGRNSREDCPSRHREVAVAVKKLGPLAEHSMFAARFEYGQGSTGLQRE